FDRKLQTIGQLGKEFPKVEGRFEANLARIDRAIRNVEDAIGPSSQWVGSTEQNPLFRTRLYEAILPLQLPLQQLRALAEVSNDNALTKIKSLQAQARLLWAGSFAALVLVVILIGTLLTRQLYRNLRELEAANAAKSNFVATVSHEIRTPLNTIRGSLGLMSADELSEDNRELLRVMQGSSDILLALVNDVLDFAKIEAGKLTIEPVETGTADMVDEVIKLMTVRAFDNETHLSSIVDPATPRMVVVDSGRLRHVLINFVGNAIKFTPRGHVNIRVSPTRDSQLRFAVEDNGPGIPWDQQSRLFNDFERMAQPVAGPEGGAGLGLAISKRLVELLGGTIGATSEPGKGSTFWFEIPCEVTQPDLPQPGGSGEFAGLRAMVLGTPAPWRSALIEQLESWDIRVRGVTWQDVDAGQDKVEAELVKENFDFMIVAGRIRPGQSLPRILETLRSRGTKLVSFGRAFGLTQLHDSYTDIADFMLRLPVTNDDLWRCVSQMTGRLVHRQPPIVEAQTAQPSRPGLAGNYRILLAEDGRANRMVAGAMLRNFGYKVDSVATGREAVSAVSSLPYDLVLMDLSMPDLDGFDAARRIRRLPSFQRNVPIIAVTAHTERETREACSAAGMDGFVAKPIDPLELSAEIERLLESNEYASGSGDTLRIVSTSLERIDRSVLDRLDRSTSGEMLPHMVRVFVDEIKDQARTLESALQTGDFDALSSESHVLKSSAGLLGARSVCVLATDLNQACKDDNQAEAEKLAGMLIDEIGHSAAAFTEDFLTEAQQH
ncbi:MAG: ATP-binding protein, partial [Gammaproteobacteria bacterium]